MILTRQFASTVTRTVGQRSAVVPVSAAMATTTASGSSIISPVQQQRTNTTTTSTSTSTSNNNTSPWATYEMAPLDPIIGLTESYLADPFPLKVNVGVGAYRNDAGKPYVLPCVHKAEQIIFESNVDMEYSGIVRTTIYYILPTTKKNILLHFLIQFNVSFHSQKKLKKKNLLLLLSLPLHWIFYLFV